MRLAGALWLCVLCSCVKSDTVATEVAELQIIAEPENATVNIDGHFAASARVLAAHPATLTPGLHLVTVEATDCFPHDMELELPPGRTTVRVSLREVPR